MPKLKPKLCCLVNPIGRCENCGILFCWFCNEKRSMDWNECTIRGINTGKMKDNHWVTKEAI